VLRLCALPAQQGQSSRNGRVYATFLHYPNSLVLGDAQGTTLYAKDVVIPEQETRRIQLASGQRCDINDKNRFAVRRSFT
ncbi:MAG: hypothetical protein KDI14_12170, partial [Halioglobus sp.]|nr:hypothetical protein [Halioglobus sp.]